MSNKSGNVVSSKIKSLMSKFQPGKTKQAVDTKVNSPPPAVETQSSSLVPEKPSETPSAKTVSNPSTLPSPHITTDTASYEDFDNSLSPSVELRLQPTTTDPAENSNETKTTVTIDPPSTKHNVPNSPPYSELSSQPSPELDPGMYEDLLPPSPTSEQPAPVEKTPTQRAAIVTQQPISSGTHPVDKGMYVDISFGTYADAKPVEDSKDFVTPPSDATEYIEYDDSTATILSTESIMKSTSTSAASPSLVQNNGYSYDIETAEISDPKLGEKKADDFGYLGVDGAYGSDDTNGVASKPDDFYYAEDQKTAVLKAESYGEPGSYFSESSDTNNAIPSVEEAPTKSNLLDSNAYLWSEAYRDTEFPGIVEKFEIQSTDLEPTDEEMKESGLLFRSSSSISSNSSTKSRSPSNSTSQITDPTILSLSFQSILDSDGSWNDRFQAIFDAPDSEFKFDAMHRLSLDFLGTAETYGKVIISELSLPDSEKSIPPVSIGGVAGGSKYRTRGIMFKFAVDIPPLCLYGSDEYAQKAAGHEMIGLNQWSLNSDGLHFPLMAIVRYCGFALVAMSTLPIGTDSLVYGSADAGRTVHFDDDLMYDKMKKTAQNLNLKGHALVANPSKLMYGPGDIEGHIGTDKLHYVLDYARVYPPAALVHGEVKEKSRCLFRLLRPELVMSFNKPLSSDAFTAWGRIGSGLHNDEVRDATQFLANVVIPSFARELSSGQIKTEGFLREMHLRGINYRYMGLIRKVCLNLAITYEYKQGANAAESLLQEMVVRCVKSIISQKWRLLIKKYKRITPDRCIQEAIGVINALIEPTTTPGSIKFWGERIRTMLVNKFPMALTEKEMEIDADGKYVTDLRQQLFQSYTGWNLIWTRLSQLTGLAFREKIMSSDSFAAVGLLSSADVTEIRTSVKQMSLVDFAYVMSTALRALRQVESTSSVRMFKAAAEKLTAAPEISSRVLKTMIGLRHYIARTVKRMQWRGSFIEEIRHFIDVAMATTQRLHAQLPTQIIVDAAVLLHDIRLPSDSVIAYLESAIVSDPMNVTPYVEIARLRAEQHEGNWNSLVDTAIARVWEIAHPDDPVINFKIGMIYFSSLGAWLGKGPPDVDQLVLKHFRKVIETGHAAFFLDADFSRFVGRQTPGSAIQSLRPTLLACLRIGHLLNCPEYDENLKQTFHEHVTCFNMVPLDRYQYSNEDLNYISSLGPWPNVVALNIPLRTQFISVESEPAFANLVKQCPNIHSTFITADIPFVGLWLESLNSKIIKRLDLNGTQTNDEHLEKMVDKLAKDNEQSELEFLVGETTTPECMSRCLKKLAGNVHISRLQTYGWCEDLPAAIEMHADTISLLGFHGKGMTGDNCSDLIAKLPNLIVLDGQRCAALDDSYVSLIASKQPFHPTLELFISQSNIHYLFTTGNTNKSVQAMHLGLKPPTVTMSIYPNEWKFPEYLRSCLTREWLQTIEGHTLPIVSIERPLWTNQKYACKVFGRSLASQVALRTVGVVNSTVVTWSLQSRTLSEIKFPSGFGGQLAFGWLINGAIKSIHMPHASSYTSLQIPIVDGSSGFYLSTGSATQIFGIKPGFCLNFWMLTIASFLLGGMN